MARNPDGGSHPPMISPASPLFHPLRHPLLSVFSVFLLLSIVLCVLYVLNRFLRPLRRRSAGGLDDIAKARPSESGLQSRRPMYVGKNTDTYGHAGDVIFCESHKKQPLYNLRTILESSVEILGSGCIGTTYKLILPDGSVVALKRLKETGLKQRECTGQQLSKLHNMNNILPLQSYYWSKGLSFLIYDYMCLGSLSSLIQGGRKYNHTPLDWPTRLTIAIDVARALKSLHKQSIVHGNIKSSNIFLQTNFTALVSEYSIVQMTCPSLAEEATLGYKAPELTDASAPNFTSDVYSFGVLLMEILTGVSPHSFSNQEVATSSKGSADRNLNTDVFNLPKWVAKRSKEKCIEDVFDLELCGARFETAVVQMLHVATACISTVVDSRPCMSKVLRMMEHIRSIQEEGCSGHFADETMSDIDTASEFGMQSIGLLDPL